MKRENGKRFVRQSTLSIQHFNFSTWQKFKCCKDEIVTDERARGVRPRNEPCCQLCSLSAP